MMVLLSLPNPSPPPILGENQGGNPSVLTNEWPNLATSQGNVTIYSSGKEKKRQYPQILLLFYH